MKNTKRLTLTMLIAAAMPLALAQPSIAGPGHNHSNDKPTATQAPKMDAKAKVIWDRAINETLSENAQDKWVKSLRFIATMSMPAQGISAEMNILLAPDKGMHMSIEIPGMGAFQKGVSGDVAWSNSMMEGPKILDGDEATQLTNELDFYADLHWEKYYSSITYKGEETITMPDDSEIESSVLELASIEDGSTSTHYYDMKTGLLVKAETTVSMAGSKIPSTVYTMDYRDVEGIMIPFKTVLSSGPIEQVIEFTTVEINGEIAEGELDLPEDIQELLED